MPPNWIPAFAGMTDYEMCVYYQCGFVDLADHALYFPHHVIPAKAGIQCQASFLSYLPTNRASLG